MSSVLRRILVRSAESLVASGFRLSSAQLDSIDGFLARSCLKRVLDQFAVNLVLDVGANDGGFAGMLRAIGYRGNIVSFEPDQRVFATLCDRFRNDAHWKGMNVALGSKNAVQSFNVAKGSHLSSFLTPVGPIVVSTDQVEVKRLDSIFDDLVSSVQKPRTLLKIDTQGYDLEVLEGAAGCIEEILILQSEISVKPIYYNMPHYTKALEVYESLGFQLMDLFAACHRNQAHGNIVEYDCLMARLDRVGV